MSSGINLLGALRGQKRTWETTSSATAISDSEDPPVWTPAEALLPGITPSEAAEPPDESPVRPTRIQRRADACSADLTQAKSCNDAGGASSPRVAC